MNSNATATDKPLSVSVVSSPEADQKTPYIPLDVTQLQDQFIREFENEKARIEQIIATALGNVNKLATLLRMQHHQLWAGTFVKLQLAIEECHSVEEDVALRKHRLDEFVASIQLSSQLLDVPSTDENM